MAYKLDLEKRRIEEFESVTDNQLEEMRRDSLANWRDAEKASDYHEYQVQKIELEQTRRKQIK